jgi:hypothetical protein
MKQLIVILFAIVALSSCKHNSEYVVQYLDNGDMITVVIEDRAEFTSLLDSLSQEGINHWTN